MTHATLPTGDATALGFDPGRLAQIGPAMQRFVDDGQVPNLEPTSSEFLCNITMARYCADI